MSKIKWKSKEDKQNKQAERDKFKEKSVDKMTIKERNELLERIARDLGYV